jgi:hypothetical protein
MKRFLLVIAFTLILASSSAWAADATAGLDINSAYVWRGITVNDGLVAQPSLEVGRGGFSLNVWGNYDIDDYDGAVNDYDFSEIDLAASYSLSTEKFDFSMGIVNYLYPGSTTESTVEVFAGVGMNLIGGLSAGFTLFYDVDEVESYYADVNLTYTLLLTDALTMEMGAKAGYAGKGFAEYYSAGTDRGFYDYAFSLKLAYALSEALSIGTALYYVGSLDKDVLPDADMAAGVWGVDTRFFGGVNIACSF